MKILVYSSVFYPNVGGIENLALVLIEQFMKAGHEVKVITEQKQDPSLEPKPFEIVESRNVLHQIRLFFWSDLVFMPNITLKGIWLFFLNPFKRLIISHNDFHIAYHSRFRAWIKLFVIRLASRNIAVSHSIADYFGFRAEVIHNCYNDAVFRIYEDESRDKDFVFVGRLVSSKGCDSLLDAFNLLEGNFGLTIIGEGPESENIRAKISAFGLQDRVKMIGFRKGEELARILNRHRVMVVPAVGWEGFGLVAIEGLACGCKVVVSQAGGLPEAVDGFGLTYPMGDADALIKQMKIAISTSEPIGNEEDKRKFLADHRSAEVAKKYLKIFSEK